mmetsp:Transcript_11631/g.16462  ORF Transcript_11631/g.16462 Transcript_11631/m.16462 type:complete len:146 (-) Transcript_11631:3-440(-)
MAMTLTCDCLLLGLIIIAQEISHTRAFVPIILTKNALPRQPLTQRWSKNQPSYQLETLCQDPKCILVHNFLSPSECQSYVEKANSFDPIQMKQSSAPGVSLQLSRLWPLPFLCMGTALPPLLRLGQQQQQQQLTPSPPISFESLL